VVRTAHDRLLPVQSHLEELASRWQFLMLLLLVACIGWSFVVDEILAAWLASLPVASEEMTVYSPHRWLQLRWGLVGLLGLLSISPLIGHQFLDFIRPGALPRELTLTRFVIAASIVTVVLAIPLLWLELLPAAFAWAERSEIASAEAAYDASLIFEVALGLSWTAVILVLACLVQFAARMTGTVGEAGDDSMRWKMHFVALLTLWLALPPTLASLWPTLALLVFLCSEGFAGLAPDRALQRGRAVTERLGRDGDVHRVALLDCGCEGACPRLRDEHGSLPGLARLSCDALCLDAEAQDLLLDALLIGRWTRLVIPGCDGMPVPERLRDALAARDCELVGASWLDRPGVDESASDQSSVLWQGLSLDALTHPWSQEAGEAAMRERVEAAATDTSLQRFEQRRSGAREWGERLGPDGLVMPLVRTGNLSRGG